MARRVVQVHDCDRCPANRPEPATEQVTLPVGDERYQLDLCTKHAAELDRILMGWARLGTLLEEPEPTRFTPTYKDDARRVAELRSRQVDRAAPMTKTIKPMRVVGDALQGLPPEAGDWIFSDHAQERMKERHISAIAALRAACQPQIRRQGDDGAMVHVADGIKVVVDDEMKVIRTVAREDRQTWPKTS